MGSALVSEPRAIQIVARDPAVGHRLATVLEGVDAAIEQRQAPGAVDAIATAPALVVIDRPDATSPHAIAGSPTIAVIPHAKLADMVAVMQTSDAVAAVVADDAVPSRLSPLATRILRDDVF